MNIHAKWVAWGVVFCGGVAMARAQSCDTMDWRPIAGVSDDECDALVTGGADDARWSPAERTLIEAVDELERTGSWSEVTWAALGRDLDDEQRIELLTAVGWYRTICTLCNALALPVESWMRTWPVSAR